MWLGALDIPQPEKQVLHGIDYSPLLFGKPVKNREEIFGQYDLHNNGLAYLRMIRTAQFKYVKHYRAKYMDELYDLKSDPDETKNLLKRRSLAKWQKNRCFSGSTTSEVAEIDPGSDSQTGLPLNRLINYEENSGSVLYFEKIVVFYLLSINICSKFV